VTPSAAERQSQALAALRRDSTLPDLLRTASVEFVEVVDATACAISRVVGEILIELVEHARDERKLMLGHGYLIPDFPLTQEVLEQGKTATCSLLEDDCEPSEAAVLRELELDSLLMLPLRSPNGPWGLAEIYVNGRAFGREDAALAEPLADAFGERLVHLPREASRLPG
jgi:GAF domain-containing protein